MKEKDPERYKKIKRAAWERFANRNPGMNAKIVAKRRAARLNATPSWGQDGIAEVYLEANSFGLTVDHIVPLQGKLVCGLHVWDNLQLLTASANNFKRHKFDPLTHVHTL